MLRAAANIAPRAVFVCGNTSTAAGLTVAVTRDGGGGGGSRVTGGGSGGDVCIEAGALILADRGVCCIDELDKISNEQHSSLLEAMEQQCISIAKSGVVTSLKSRTSVLAAANPAGGHYNRQKSVCENLKMNAALLSRFGEITVSSSPSLFLHQNILVSCVLLLCNDLLSFAIIHHSYSASFVDFIIPYKVQCRIFTYFFYFSHDVSMVHGARRFDIYTTRQA